MLLLIGTTAANGAHDVDHIRTYESDTNEQFTYSGVFYILVIILTLILTDIVRQTTMSGRSMLHICITILMKYGDSCRECDRGLLR